MIRIEIRTILTLKRIIGQGSVELILPEGSTLRNLLTSMVKAWGSELESYLFDADGNLYQHIRLLINGQDIAFLNKMDTVLQDEDKILILPPVVGG